MKLKRVLWVFVLVGLSGCGGKKTDLEFLPVKGVVILDGVPLADADVSAVPVGKTMGLGGGGRTNANGEFQLKHARGESGLPAGEYKLGVSLRKRPDGTVPPADDPTPPIDSNAVETLSPKYSDPANSVITLTVPLATPTIEIKVEAAKKK